MLYKWNLWPRPEVPFIEHEDLFRINAVGMEWDIGAHIYEPSDPSKIAIGADGKKVGVYLLSGGDGDFKTMAPVAKLLCGKFGFKVTTMTYPGRLCLAEASRCLSKTKAPRICHCRNLKSKFTTEQLSDRCHRFEVAITTRQ